MAYPPDPLEIVKVVNGASVVNDSSNTTNYKSLADTIKEIISETEPDKRPGVLLEILEHLDEFFSRPLSTPRTPADADEWILVYKGSEGMHGVTSSPQRGQRYPSQELRDWCVKICGYQSNSKQVAPDGSANY